MPGDYVATFNTQDKYSSEILTVNQNFTIQEYNVVMIPDAFSPYSTINVNWKPLVNSSLVNKYYLVVNDKDGNIMFESNDVEARWDGNNAMIDQSYNYILQIELINCKSIKLTGNVLITE